MCKAIINFAQKAIGHAADAVTNLAGHSSATQAPAPAPTKPSISKPKAPTQTAAQKAETKKIKKQAAQNNIEPNKRFNYMQSLLLPDANANAGLSPNSGILNLLMPKLKKRSLIPGRN